MTERINRRDHIVESSFRLFQERGYEATTTREIAEAAGVTEAGLYYHFKEGKRSILKEVLLRKVPVFEDIVNRCGQASSLEELIIIYFTVMRDLGPGHMETTRWLMAELPMFTPEELHEVQECFLVFLNGMGEILTAHIPSPEIAEQYAITLLCIAFGYGTLFWTLGLNKRKEVPTDSLVTMMAHMMAANIGE